MERQKLIAQIEELFTLRNTQPDKAVDALNDLGVRTIGKVKCTRVDGQYRTLYYCSFPECGERFYWNEQTNHITIF